MLRYAIIETSENRKDQECLAENVCNNRKRVLLYYRCLQASARGGENPKIENENSKPQSNSVANPQYTMTQKNSVHGQPKIVSKCADHRCTYRVLRRMRYQKGM